MRLSELLAALPPALAATRVGIGGDPVIRGLQIDSRQVVPGQLFVALRGEQADGHDHLGEAERLGAAALLVEAIPAGFEPATPVAQVTQTRRALAPVATRFFGDPSADLRVVGVTGTNGKTSTTFLVDAILRAAGVESGLIGTLGSRIGDEWQRALNTTPESLDLQRTLNDMRTHGVRAVAMEVSSHGLSLGRVDGCRFEVAAVTNLTQDHLDFHDSMHAYAEAKARLFREHLDPTGTAVVNVDDAHAERFLTAARERGARLVRTSRRADVVAEVRIESASVRSDGTRARLALPGRTLEVELPLLGDFNLENLAVAVGTCLALELPDEAIARGVASCPQVPGRVEHVGAEISGAPTVLVDYAHTPDAVEKLLLAVRPLARGRIVTVFGCGGDRDKAKRPLMARAVSRHADLAIATSDNPRTEDPAAILEDVEAGLGDLHRVEPEKLGDQKASYSVVEDRRAAIDLAIQIARPEDTVVLAGKGHEDYQIIGRERLPFDDRQEALRALRNLDS